MSEVLSDEAKRLVVGNFEIQLQLTKERTIKVAGYVYSDDKPHDVSSRFDSFQDQLDRQMIRCDIVTKRAQIASQLINIDQIKWLHKEILALREGGKKLTSTQLQQLQNAEPSLARAKEIIDSLNAAIAEAEKKLAA